LKWSSQTGPARRTAPAFVWAGFGAFARSGVRCAAPAASLRKRAPGSYGKLAGGTSDRREVNCRGRGGAGHTVIARVPKGPAPGSSRRKPLTQKPQIARRREPRGCGAPQGARPFAIRPRGAGVARRRSKTDAPRGAPRPLMLRMRAPDTDGVPGAAKNTGGSARLDRTVRASRSAACPPRPIPGLPRLTADALDIKYLSS
jgi:hypothetical protein